MHQIPAERLSEPAPKWASHIMRQQEAEIARLRTALADAEKRLRGAGMLGGDDDPVRT